VAKNRKRGTSGRDKLKSIGRRTWRVGIIGKKKKKKKKKKQLKERAGGTEQKQ